VPLATLTGINLNRGGRQLSRPAGTIRRGAYGQEEATPPIYRLFSDPAEALGEIGYVASQQAPSPIRALRDLTVTSGGDARYDTGHTITSGGVPLPDPNRSRLGSVLRGLNLPAPRRVDIVEMVRRAREQRERQRG
jgi:hypothetical protein